MKKILLFILMFLLYINIVFSASFRTEYSPYMDVNVVENVIVHIDEEISNQSSWIFVDGTLTNMSIRDNYSWLVGLTGSEESNTSYLIQIINNKDILTNSSDMTREDYLTIKNSSLFGFINYSKLNDTKGDLEHNEVCPYIKKQKGNPILKGFIGNQNELGVLNITINYGDSLSIINNVYDYICLEVAYAYDKNYTNLIEFLGFQCVNCDDDNQIRLGLDTTLINNLSLILINSTNYTINYDNNYMIKALEVEGILLEEFYGVFYFRNPYYITFEFYYGVNQTTKEQRRYKNIFDYVYLYEFNYSNKTGLQTPAIFGDIIEIFALIPGMESFYGTDRYVYDKDIDTFFWADYDDISATIKLYELSWHKLNIMGSDLKVISANFSEFNKPVVGSKYWQTQITSLNMGLLLNDVKKNTTFKVYLQPWEANKSQFMLDILKWLMMFFGLIIILSIEIGLGVDGKVIGYTILAYMAIIGGIGWVV